MTAIRAAGSVLGYPRTNARCETHQSSGTPLNDAAPRPSRETIVAFIADIFERRGAEDYLGEPVTVSEHMLQCAGLAEEAGASDELVAAALLHDIGHFTSEFGTYSSDDEHDRHHDEAGAKVLEPFFPPIVTECARLHVAAKRYLCTVDPDYFSILSPASVHTLALQGGPMSQAEVERFKECRFHAEAVQVRLWDEGGKTPGARTRSFRDYEVVLQRIVDPSHHGGSMARRLPGGPMSPE